MERVSISVIQYEQFPIKEIRDFYYEIDYYLDLISKSNFIIFPEAFSMQLITALKEESLEKRFRKIAEEHYSKITNYFREKACKLNSCIIAGSHPKIINGKMFNVSPICMPNKNVYEQIKIHLTSPEKLWNYNEGDSVKVFSYNGIKFGVSICYDIEFPELSRYMSIKGAKIIFCPSYTTSEHGFWRVRFSCHSRAIENQAYVVHSANYGDIGIPELRAYGASAIISPCIEPYPPNGLLIEGNKNRREVVSYEVNLKILDEIRKAGIVTNIDDSIKHLELYLKLYEDLKRIS